MRLEPLATRIVVEEIDEGRLTAGGLWKPDIARKNALSYCTVIAAGPGRRDATGQLVPNAVKEGMVIMVPTQSLAHLPLKDERGSEKDFLMCVENDVIGIIHGMESKTRIVDAAGSALLSVAPQSLALPDSAYANMDAHARAVSDLQQSNAPPDVIAEMQEQLIDGTD